MIYDYSCTKCGTSQDNVYNTIARRNLAAPVCCGERMAIVINSAPYGYLQRDVRYVCPVTNENVTTRRQRKYIMEKHDFINANDFSRTFEQRASAEAKNKAEIQAIKDAVPKDLTEHFGGMKQDFKKQFLNQE